MTKIVKQSGKSKLSNHNILKLKIKSGFNYLK